MTLAGIVDTKTFEEAVEKYEAATSRCWAVAEGLRGAQQDVREGERELELQEAMVRMDPGILWGKSKEERDAQVVAALDADDDYGAQLIAIDTHRNAVSKYQDEMKQARDEMSLQKRVMDWAIAQTRFLTEEPSHDAV